MSKDIKNFIKSCLSCQKAKISRHTRSDILPYPISTERFSHINIDLVGPLPYCNGFRYLLTCIDRFTRWTEAIPLEDSKALTVANAFYRGWIARFGVPLKISTDQGQQFEAELFKEFGRILGSQRIPSANGMIEKWHRCLKTALACHCNSSWYDVLPTILLGLRSSFLESIKSSPSELVYGTSLRLPGDFFAETLVGPPTNDFVKSLRIKMNSLKPVAPVYKSNRTIFVSQNLQNCDFVFVRDDSVKKSLQPPYQGPFPVIKKSQKIFTLNINGHEKAISIDRLKPAYVFNTDIKEDAKLVHTTNFRPNQIPTRLRTRNVTFR